MVVSVHPPEEVDASSNTTPQVPVLQPGIPPPKAMPNIFPEGSRRNEKGALPSFPLKVWRMVSVSWALAVAVRVKAMAPRARGMMRERLVFISVPDSFDLFCFGSFVEILR